MKSAIQSRVKMRGGLIREERTVASRNAQNETWQEVEVDTLVGQMAAEIDDAYPNENQAWDIKQKIRSFLIEHFLVDAPIEENNVYFEEQLEIATGLPNINNDVRNSVWNVYRKLRDFDGNLFADAFTAHLEMPNWMQDGGKKNNRKNKKTRKTRKTRKATKSRKTSKGRRK
jgi:hypothetical protein